MDLLMKFNCVSATRGGATIKLVEPRTAEQQHQQQQSQQQNQQPDNKLSLSSPASCAECCNSANNCSSVGGPCTDLSCIANTTTPFSYCIGGSSNTMNPPPPCCTPSKYINNQSVISAPPPLPPPLTPLANNGISSYNTQATISADNLECSSKYTYEEPEENFISIDDAKIEKFLLKIGYELEAEKKALKENQLRNETAPYEIVELDDDQDEDLETPNLPTNCRITTIDKSITKQAQKRTSPDICLIPKLSRPSTQQKIVAQIDLLDSSDSEYDEQNIGDDDNDSYEELPLTAAAALSCELSVDDDDDDDVDIQGVPPKEQNNEEEYVDVGDYGPELHWDDCSDQKPRNLFECLVCGKKVQSNYNLRRHMMIHTGERPFGCDLCERRFREFSDLKKHRRRHANEANYLCMICHQNCPLEHDSIRCANCESKNLVLKPQSEATAAAKIVQSMPKVATLSQSSQNQIKKAARAPSTSQQKLTLLQKKRSSEDLQNDDDVSKKAKQQTLTRQRAFQCTLCHREFGTRHNLKRHFMIHTGEKPFSCSKCRKPFREYSTLKKHMVTHQRDRWYKCIRCSQKYRDYLLYMAHKQTHPGWDVLKEEGNTDQWSKSGKQSSHDDSNDDDSFVYEEGDDSTPEHSLECCECGENFTDFDAYTEHMEQHGPKVVYHYECYICEEEFEEREALESHMAKHEEIKKN